MSSTTCDRAVYMGRRSDLVNRERGSVDDRVVKGVYDQSRPVISSAMLSKRQDTPSDSCNGRVWAGPLVISIRTVFKRPQSNILRPSEPTDHVLVDLFQPVTAIPHLLQNRHPFCRGTTRRIEQLGVLIVMPEYKPDEVARHCFGVDATDKPMRLEFD